MIASLKVRILTAAAEKPETLALAAFAAIVCGVPAVIGIVSFLF